jgi:uncharacterized sulfatase
MGLARLFVRVSIACAAIGLCATSLAGAASAQRERVNVVLIYADDLGYGDLSCYGHPQFKTPHIDRLAAEGARLTHFYSPVPYCAPSRGTLLTGRYPFRSGLTGNPVPAKDPAGDGRADHLGLPPEEVTLAEALGGAGYRTACFGKWHLGHHSQFRPLRQGFDEYLGVLYSNDMHPVELWDGERMVEYPLVQATLTRRLTERSVRFIEQNRDRPFLLYLPHAMPHKPLACSEEFYGKSGAGLYGDVMAELDWSVGQVTAKLKELGLERNTLLVFASDNGPWYGGSTGGLRGMKGQTWEGGLRVPMIARWPGRIPPGRVIETPAVAADVFATSLAAAGVPSPPGRRIDGKDLLPLLKGETTESPHEALFFMAGARLAAVRSGRWKLHVVAPGAARDREWKPEDPYTDPRRPDGVRILAPYEQYHPSRHPGGRTGDPAAAGALFDLRTDPSEQRNVADRHPDVVRRLRALSEAALRSQ